MTLIAQILYVRGIEPLINDLRRRLVIILMCPTVLRGERFT